MINCLQMHSQSVLDFQSCENPVKYDLALSSRLAANQDEVAQKDGASGKHTLDQLFRNL